MSPLNSLFMKYPSLSLWMSTEKVDVTLESNVPKVSVIGEE